MVIKEKGGNNVSQVLRSSVIPFGFLRGSYILISCMCSMMVSLYISLLEFLRQVEVDLDNQINCSSEQSGGISIIVEPNPDNPG